MDPLLIDVPERIETERLILRCPRPGDGAMRERGRARDRSHELQALDALGADGADAWTNRRRIAAACRRASCCARTW